MVLSATQHCSIEQAEHVEMCVNDDFITQSQNLQHVLLLYIPGPPYNPIVSISHKTRA